MPISSAETISNWNRIYTQLVRYWISLVRVLTYLDSGLIQDKSFVVKLLETWSTHLSYISFLRVQTPVFMQVIGDVLAMNTIARNLHARRFQQGALRLDKTKLSFSLNQDGNPQNYRIQCKQYTTLSYFTYPIVSKHCQTT